MEGIVYRGDGLINVKFVNVAPPFDDGIDCQTIFVSPNLISIWVGALYWIDYTYNVFNREWYRDNYDGFESTSKRLILNYVRTHAKSMIDHDELVIKGLYDMVTKIRKAEDIFKEVLDEILHVYTDVKSAERRAT